MAISLPNVLRRIESDAAPASGSSSDQGGEYQTFLVQCETFRCLAYRDRAGKWRGVYDNRELAAVKAVVCAMQ